MALNKKDKAAALAERDRVSAHYRAAHKAWTEGVLNRDPHRRLATLVSWARTLEGAGINTMLDAVRGATWLRSADQETRWVALRLLSEPIEKARTAAGTDALSDPLWDDEPDAWIELRDLLRFPLTVDNERTAQKMSMQVSVTATTPEDVAALLAFLAGRGSPAPVKAEEPPALPAPVVHEENVKVAEAPLPAVPEKVWDLAEVRELFVAHYRAVGHAQATGLLAKYGAAKLQDVKPSDFAAFVAEMHDNGAHQ